GGFDSPAFGDVTCVVAPIERQILPRATEAVAEEGIAPTKPAVERFRIGIDQQLVRIEPVSVRGIKRPVDAVAVKQVRSGVRQIHMPDLVGVFRKRDPRLLTIAGAIEEAKLDLFSMSRKDGKIDALAVPRRPERVGT